MIAPPIIDRWQLIFNWTHLIRPVLPFASIHPSSSDSVITLRSSEEQFKAWKGGYLNVCHSSVAHMCIRQRLKQASDPSTEWLPHHNNEKKLEEIGMYIGSYHLPLQIKDSNFFNFPLLVIDWPWSTSFHVYNSFSEAYAWFKTSQFKSTDRISP